MDKEIAIPLVSIVCDTYNQVNYIRQCLDGILMQETNFPIEILVHDDASTDGTVDIVKEYETKYPYLIKPIYQRENQYSKGVKVTLEYQYSRAKGKYIAFCEGDDFWTDPLKLQKQVDFLEANQDYVLCTHHFSRYYQTRNRYEENRSTRVAVNRTFTIEDYVLYNNWLTQPLTALYRRESLNIRDLIIHPHMKDTILFYYILKHGKGYLMNECMGVYRIHQGGVWSGGRTYEQAHSNISAIKSIYDIEHSAISVKYLYNCLYSQGYLGISFFIRYWKLYIRVLLIFFQNLNLSTVLTILKRTLMYSK